MTNTNDTPAALAAKYFESWRNNDFDTLRSLLADDATFVGPLGKAGNGDECRAGIEQLSKIKTDLVVKQICADGADVMTWFDLHTTVAAPTPVVNWSHVVDGRIARIRATFDPRALLEGQGR